VVIKRRDLISFLIASSATLLYYSRSGVIPKSNSTALKAATTFLVNAFAFEPIDPGTPDFEFA
jgi:hypothetical protein